MQRKEDVTRHWHLIDASGKILGRVATQVAKLLTGKDKPEFTPHIDGGDFVVVINAAQIQVTGTKLETKLYHKHSGFIGNLKRQSLGQMLATKPELVIKKAVFNMIPKNRLRPGRMTRLKIYAGGEHLHQAQLASKQK